MTHLKGANYFIFLIPSSSERSEIMFLTILHFIYFTIEEQTGHL